MCRRVVRFAWLILAVADLGAQEARTVSGARNAAISILRSRYPADTNIVWYVSDSATMWRDHVVCPDSTAPEWCIFRDAKPVRVVKAELLTESTAAIDIFEYHVLKAKCPSGAPFVHPRIAMIHSEHFVLKYETDRWSISGREISVDC
jgi:hypothetical protein